MEYCITITSFTTRTKRTKEKLDINKIRIVWARNRKLSSNWLYVLVMSHTHFRVHTHSCLNVKELLARSRCKIWRLSDCIWTRTQNHLACKWALNQLSPVAITKLSSNVHSSLLLILLIAFIKSKYCYNKKKQIEKINGNLYVEFPLQSSGNLTCCIKAKFWYSEDVNKNPV